MFNAVTAKYRQAYSGLPRDAWALSLILFIDMSGTMVIFFLALYLTRHLGFSVFQAGQVLSAYGMGMLLGTFLGGLLSDRLGPRRTQQLSLAFSFGFVLGPALGTRIYEQFGGPVLWWGVTGLATVIAAGFLRSMDIPKAAEASETPFSSRGDE